MADDGSAVSRAWLDYANGQATVAEQSAFCAGFRAGLAHARTWRPLGESLPEEGQLVALLSRGRDADEYSEGWPDWYDVARWERRHFLTFSHWHPLPPLPPSPWRRAAATDRCEVCPALPVGRTLDDVPLCAEHAPKGGSNV